MEDKENAAHGPVSARSDGAAPSWMKGTASSKQRVTADAGPSQQQGLAVLALSPRAAYYITHGADRAARKPWKDIATVMDRRGQAAPAGSGAARSR